MAVLKGRQADKYGTRTTNAGIKGKGRDTLDSRKAKKMNKERKGRKRKRGKEINFVEGKRLLTS